MNKNINLVFSTLAEIICRGRPVVVSSSLWPIARITKCPVQELVSYFIKDLRNICKNTTLLMPTHTNGFIDGVCNLDLRPSIMGVLSETFRKIEGVDRTFDPFFSYAVEGECKKQLLTLNPIDARGKGSIYEWLYEKNAHLVTIGIPPVQCSYTHYAESLMQELISYRCFKNFTGKLIYKQKELCVGRKVFVMKPGSSQVNDFSELLDPYLEGGLQYFNFGGILLSEIGAKRKTDIILKILKENPFALIKRT